MPPNKKSLRKLYGKLSVFTEMIILQIVIGKNACDVAFVEKSAKLFHT